MKAGSSIDLRLAHVLVPSNVNNVWDRNGVQDDGHVCRGALHASPIRFMNGTRLMKHPSAKSQSSKSESQYSKSKDQGYERVFEDSALGQISILCFASANSSTHFGSEHRTMPPIRIKQPCALFSLRSFLLFYMGMPWTSHTWHVFVHPFVRDESHAFDVLWLRS